MNYLKCSHRIGRNCFEYLMPCKVLKKTKSGKLKVEVYGDRYWKNTEHIKKIRYVDGYRVIERQP